MLTVRLPGSTKREFMLSLLVLQVEEVDRHAKHEYRAQESRVVVQRRSGEGTGVQPEDCGARSETGVASRKEAPAVSTGPQIAISACRGTDTGFSHSLVYSPSLRFKPLQMPVPASGRAPQEHSENRRKLQALQTSSSQALKSGSGRRCRMLLFRVLVRSVC